VLPLVSLEEGAELEVIDRSLTVPPLVDLEEGAELELVDRWRRFDLQSGIRPARLNFLAGIWLAVSISFIARLKKKRIVSVR
jgi:hypothetical protein